MIGFLDGGVEVWKVVGEEVDIIEDIMVVEFVVCFKDFKNLLDVCCVSEYNVEYVVGLKNFLLDFINFNMNQLNCDEQYVVYCVGGYCFVIVVLILKVCGFDKVVNIFGGYKVLVEINLLCIEYVEQLIELQI